MLNGILLSAQATYRAQSGGLLVLIYAAFLIVLITFIVILLKKFNVAKLVLGAIFAIIGLVATVYGGIQRASVEYKLGVIFGVEATKTIDIVFYIGIATLIVGLAILIVYFIKKNAK